MVANSQLFCGEQRYSLEEAAHQLRVSVATLRMRMGSASDPEDGPRVTRNLTAAQVAGLAKEFARRRAGGLLSLDEAARFVEISEEELLRHVESGELREADQGSAFFARKRLERLFARRLGVADPLTMAEAMKMAKVDHRTIKWWMRTGCIKGTRVGNRLFISRSDLEIESRRQDRVRERLRVLQVAGRLLTTIEAAGFLGICPGALRNIEMKRLKLEPLRLRRWWLTYYRRRDLERVALARAERRNPPAHTLHAREVVDALEISTTRFLDLVRAGKLHVVAKRKTGLVVVNGYDPNEVERIKAELEAERGRLSRLVKVPGAAEILGVSEATIRNLMQLKLLTPEPPAYPARFRPEDVDALKEHPFVLERRLPAAWNKARMEARSAKHLVIKPRMRRIVRSISEAARYLEVSEQVVREHMARGELRKVGGGRQFCRADLLLLLARRDGMRDPIRLHEAKSALPDAEHLRRTGFLKGVKVGRATFVSKSEVDREARRRKEALLSEAGGARQGRQANEA